MKKRSILAWVLILLMVFGNMGFGGGVVFAEGEDPVVTDYYPKVEYAAKIGERFTIDIYGNYLNSIKAIGLYTTEDTEMATNLIEEVSKGTYEDGINWYEFEYLFDLNPTTNYVVGITSNGGGAPIILPFDVVEEAYSFNQTSLQVGQQNFAMKLYSRNAGTSALLDKTVEFYNETPDYTDPIGTGLITKYQGYMLMLVNMESPVQPNQIIPYKILGIDNEAIKHFNGAEPNQLNMIAPSEVNLQIFRTDWDSFHASVDDLDAEDVVIQFWGTGIEADLSQFESIQLIDTSPDPVPNMSIMEMSTSGAAVILSGPSQPVTMQTIRFEIPKSSFTLDHEYEVQFNLKSGAQIGHGTFALLSSVTPPEFDVFWLSPGALTYGADEFFFNMGGNKLDTVTSVGLYEVSGTDNLIESVDGNFRQESNYYQDRFKLIDGFSFDPNKTYEFRISDGNTDISRNLVLGELIYYLDYDHVGGKDQMLISLQLKGSEADKTYFLEHGIINYYADANFTNLIGSGKVVQLEPESDRYFVTVDFVDGYALGTEGDYYFKFNDFADKDFKPEFDAHISRNPAVMLREAEVSTESSDVYEINLLTYGVSSDLEVGCDVLKLTGDNGFEINIKEAITSSPGSVSVSVTTAAVSVDAKEYTFDSLTIKLNKNISGLELGKNYHLQFDARKDFGWGMDFQLGSLPPVFGVDWNYPTAQEVRSSGDYGFYMLTGSLLNGIKGFGLYETDDSTNLIKEVAITEERDEKHFYEFKFNTNLNKAKTYEIRVVGPDDTIIKFPYDVVTETYEADSQLQIGKSKFYVQTSLGLYDQSPLLGKQLNFYADNDGTGTPVGTGEFVMDSGIAFIKVNLNEAVVSNQRLYYKVLNVDGMDIKHRGYTDGNLPSIDAGSSNNPHLFGADFSIFNDSQIDASDESIDFMFLTENISVTNNALDQFTGIKLYDINDDTEVSLSGMAGMTMEKYASDIETCDRILIQVPKTSFVKGHSYDVRFYGQNSYWSFGTFDIKGLKVDYYQKAIEKFLINNENWIYIAGTLFGEIKEWGLFNKTDNRKISEVDETSQNTQNVIEARYHFTESYVPGNQYELRVIDKNNVVLNLPINVADVVFNHDERSIQVGKTDFYIYVYGDNQSPLMGKTINFYKNQERTIPNGSGQFKVIEGMPVIEVKLQEVTQLGDKLYYAIQGMGGLTVAHSDVLDQSEANFDNSFGTMPTIIGDDRAAYESTLADPTKAYVDYKFYGLNVNGNSNAFESISLIDENVTSFNKSISEIEGASIIIGTAFNGLVDTLTIRVPKDALLADHIYTVKFTDDGRVWDRTGFEMTSLKAEWLSPRALTLESAKNFNVHLNGKLLNTVTSVGLFLKGGNNTSLTSLDVDSVKKSFNDYDGQLELLSGVVLNPDLNYEIRISDGHSTLTRDIDIADVTYYLDWDTIGGQDLFLLSLQIDGSNDVRGTFKDHTIKYFSEDTYVNQIGSGKVIELDGRYFVTVDLNDDFAFGGDTKLFYKFDNFGAEKDYQVKYYHQINGYEAAMPFDHIKVLQASLGDSSTSYDIAVGHYGISADLETGCTKLELVDGFTNDVVVDVKAEIKKGNASKVKVESLEKEVSVDGTIFTYEELTLKFDKTLMGKGKWYYLNYEAEEGLMWSTWFKMSDIDKASTIALDKLDVYPYITLSGYGLRANSWIDLELYESVNGANVGENLLKITQTAEMVTYDEDAYYGTCLFDFVLKQGITLDPTKTYSLKVIIDGQVDGILLPITVKYKPDFNGDGFVRPSDLAMMVLKHNLKIGQEGYDPLMDMNEDGIINLKDYKIVSKMLWQ